MPRESKVKRTERTARIIAALQKAYPDAHCELNHTNALELLVATILSAQCTDVRVNIVTADLFKKYRTAADYAAVPQEQFEQEIRSTGFFRNKARNIRAAAARLVENFGGKVPGTMDELLTLPGVARKTANVVLGNIFGVNDGIVVDTHVARLAGRLKLSTRKTPEKIEPDLMAVVPQDLWCDFSHLLIFHGRRCCAARKPDCAGCCVRKLCPSAFRFDGHNSRTSQAGAKP